jgi:anti-sigma factor RsiW
VNREEAKLILQVCRPGGQDAEDPQFAEALALVKSDAELAAWFADQQKFDAFASRKLKSVVVPSGLKAKILADAIPARQKIVELSTPAWWQKLLHSPVSWAMAVVVVIFLSLAFYWKQPESTAHFADYSAQMVSAAVNDAHHVDVENSDMKQVVAWLGEHHGENKFVLPVALKGSNGLVGCRVLEWHGQKISMLCYGLSGPGHVDLFVAEANVFPDAPPEDKPQYVSSGGMPTASWSHDGMVYLMVGHSADADLRKLLQPETTASEEKRLFPECFRL